MPKSSYSKKGSRKGGRKRLRPTISSFTTSNRTLRNITPNSGWLSWKCVDITDNVFTVTGIAANNSAATATVISLNDVNEGSGFYNRIGRTICLKSLTIDYRIYPNSVATNPPTLVHYIRCMLVYDSQPNGSLATFANIFQNISASGSVVNHGTAFPNVDNKDRFKILYDHVHQLNPNSGATVPGAMVDVDDTHVKRKVALKSLETKYSSASSASASGINTGALLFLALDLTAGTTTENSYSLNLNTRCMFTD